MKKSGNNLFFYIDNNSKHISIWLLEWFKRNQIKVDLSPLHSPELNPILILWRISKNKMRGLEFLSLDLLKRVFKGEWEVFQRILLK